MKFLKNAFLFSVGAVVVAYEETVKVVKHQRKMIEDTIRKTEKEVKAA